MAGAVPGVVGQQHITRRQRVYGKPVQEKSDTGGHRVDVAGRTGHGLRQHASLRIENPGGQVARFPYRGGKGGSNEGLRLFLDHRQQAVPENLRVDTVHRGRFIHHGFPPGASSQYDPGRRSLRGSSRSRPWLSGPR